MPSEGSSRTERPARLKPARRLRFHLITWLAMFLVASAFLGLNVVPQGPYMIDFFGPSDAIGAYTWARCRGWPLHYEATGEEKLVFLDKSRSGLLRGPDGGYLEEHSGLPVNEAGERFLPDPNKGEITKARMIPGKVGRMGAMFCNLLLGLSACGVIGLTVEWFARKRRATAARGEE